MNNKVPEQTIINLYKIADHLEKNVSDEQFDISEWRGKASGNEIIKCDYFSKHDCGTIGCAIGHAVFIEGLEPIEDDFSSYLGSGFTLDFREYGHRIVEGISDGNFEYVFGADNHLDHSKRTRDATIARIRELADNGGVLAYKIFIPSPVLY